MKSAGKKSKDKKVEQIASMNRPNSVVKALGNTPSALDEAPPITGRTRKETKTLLETQLSKEEKELAKKAEQKRKREEKKI